MSTSKKRNEQRDMCVQSAIKTRRHHNNNGAVQIQRGKTYKYISIVARKLGVRNTGPRLKDMIEF